MPKKLTNTSLLNDYKIKFDTFKNINKVFNQFQQAPFQHLGHHQKNLVISQVLLKLILDSPKNSFLLVAVTQFITRINDEIDLQEPYHINAFEFWLNNFSGLTNEENFQVRAQITGKRIPREDYQSLFPIGMGKTFFGTHFVAAHLSPDVDSTIASFWGWVDAFAARVGSSLHIWNLPGGPPDSPVIQIFKKHFGQGIFTFLAQTSSTLTLTARDLLTQKNMSQQPATNLTTAIQHPLADDSLILLDTTGHYLGDWRPSDLELIRPLVIQFKACLHWFENHFLAQLIALLSKKNCHIEAFASFISIFFQTKFENCPPIMALNDKQKKLFHHFLFSALSLPNGIASTFTDLNKSLKNLTIPEMDLFEKQLKQFKNLPLFDHSGYLIENRPKLFNALQKIIKHLAEAIRKARNVADRLDVAMKIKQAVLGVAPLYLLLKSDVDEIRQKITPFNSLTVVNPDKEDRLFPLGIVRMNDLLQPYLGTISFRDFCNHEEIQMASYLEVISVMDHHKASLTTSSTPLALIGDAQSCNVLLAEQAFNINDRYGLGGMAPKQILKEMQNFNKTEKTFSEMRCFSQLVKKRMALQSHPQYFVHPDREYLEYLYFLHAILDDTDLLSKVSDRDVECVASLLNRLKSISLGHEIEITNGDGFVKDQFFAKKMASHLLQNPDLYSIYNQVYSLREKEVDTNLNYCLKKLIIKYFS